MASRKTLNAKDLEALGAERLAELLIEVSTRVASINVRPGLLVTLGEVGKVATTDEQSPTSSSTSATLFGFSLTATPCASSGSGLSGRGRRNHQDLLLLSKVSQGQP